MDDQVRCNWCGEEIRGGTSYHFRDEKSGRLYYHHGCFNHEARYRESKAGVQTTL